MRGQNQGLTKSFSGYRFSSFDRSGESRQGGGPGNDLAAMILEKRHVRVRGRHPLQGKLQIRVHDVVRVNEQRWLRKTSAQDPHDRR